MKAGLIYFLNSNTSIHQTPLTKRVFSCILCQLCGLLAQLVEHRPFKPWVTGSSPVQPTTNIASPIASGRLYLPLTNLRSPPTLSTDLSQGVFHARTSFLQCPCNQRRYCCTRRLSPLRHSPTTRRATTSYHYGDLERTHAGICASPSSPWL
jgi:hypothetical protein